LAALTSSIDFFHAFASPLKFTTKWSSAGCLPGALGPEKAEWAELKKLLHQADVLAAQQKYAFGVGELSDYGDQNSWHPHGEISVHV